MTYSLGRNTLKNLETLSSKDLIVIVAQAIQITKQDFCIVGSGGLRTAEQQNAIFKKGYSRCDGYIKKSRHQSGRAVDLVPFIDGKPTWYAPATVEIVKAMKTVAEENGLKLFCGADWTDFYDPYHFEIRS